MAHYAKIENGLVVTVVVADEDWVATQEGQWVQTSYNTRGGIHYDDDGKPDGGVPLRKNYAGIGFSYDPVRDAFIPPNKLQSWVLDEASCTWKSPVPRPDDGKAYRWDEDTVSWVYVPPPPELEG